MTPPPPPLQAGQLGDLGFSADDSAIAATKSKADRLCPVLWPPPNPTECDGLSQHRWKGLLDKESVAFHHNW